VTRLVLNVQYSALTHTMSPVVLLCLLFSVIYCKGADACPDDSRGYATMASCIGHYFRCVQKGLTRVPANIPTDTCQL
jgi:hypothetical protein